MGERFEYVGTYRVQSRRTAVPSSLAGMWLTDRPGLLTESKVNAELVRDSRWQGRAQVALQPAIVTQRAGQFASERDILYKKSFFSPAAASSPMQADIVDVQKSEGLWSSRLPHLQALFGHATVGAIEGRLAPLDVVIANEYFMHEAGHFLGIDVLGKYVKGYFTVGGKTAWPLVYLEELRADLEGFGLARRLLTPEQAICSFLYTVALRFGVHRAGVREEGIAPYGTIPYLLFHFLSTVGFLRVAPINGCPAFVIKSLDTDFVLSVMEQSAAHAQEQITGPESAAESLLDAAIAGANYVRSRVSDGASAAAFDAVMRSGNAVRGGA